MSTLCAGAALLLALLLTPAWEGETAVASRPDPESSPRGEATRPPPAAADGFLIEIPIAQPSSPAPPKGEAPFSPIAVFGWRSSDMPVRVPGDETKDWRNVTVTAAVGDAFAASAEPYRPAFPFLGNESDFYRALDPFDDARCGRH